MRAKAPPFPNHGEKSGLTMASGPDGLILFPRYSSSAMLLEGIWKDFDRKTVRRKVWDLSPG